MNKKYFESESLKDAMWKNFYKEEDKWESIPEANFLENGGVPRHWFQLGFGAGLDAVVRADPVPREMSAKEFGRAMLRLRKERAATVDNLITYLNLEDAVKGRNVDEAVAIVEKWAREHPEEVKQ